MQSKSQFLFHGTGIYCLASIIESNTLEEGTHWGKPNEPHGPRLTEDFDVAKSFIAYNMHWGEGGVLVLDREKLARDFDLVAYEDKRYDGGDFGHNEREIAVVTPIIKSLSKYLVSIVCNPEVIQLAALRENMETAHEECGWVHAWGSPYEVSGRRKMHRSFDALKASPFLNSDAFHPEALPVSGNWPIMDVENTARVS